MYFKLMNMFIDSAPAQTTTRAAGRRRSVRRGAAADTTPQIQTGAEPGGKAKKGSKAGK